jgi:hypothetical protein
MKICKADGSKSNYVQLKSPPSDFKDFNQFVKKLFQSEFPNETSFDIFYKKNNEETHFPVLNQTTYNQCLVDLKAKLFAWIYYSPTVINESVSWSIIKAENKGSLHSLQENIQRFSEKIATPMVESELEEGNQFNESMEEEKEDDDELLERRRKKKSKIGFYRKNLKMSKQPEIIPDSMMKK